MVARAREQGAEVVLGGRRPEGGEFGRGFWYQPTVLTGVRNDMEIMQQEVFGPVSPVMAFDDFDEAIALANDTPYGLSAYLFTSDLKKMMRAVNALRSGEVYINKIGPEQFQGFHAGYGLSGMGGDDGHHGYAHYFRKKTVYVSYGEGSTEGMMPYGSAAAPLPPQ
jgi:lactaldehyde dehydrogenase/glycolaldehyde dehydrogenase